MIRLAILDDNKDYKERISRALSSQFEDLQLFAFSDPDEALEQMKIKRIKVLLASESFEINKKKLPDNSGFAYLVDVQGIDSVNGEKAICRYQRIDLIYQEILGIYAGLGIGLSHRGDKNSCRLYCFSSPTGGVGKSTVAAAFARKCVKNGKRTFYLNLEAFGAPDLFFRGDGIYTLSELIYSVKKGNVDIPLKIRSCQKEDPSGVKFVSRTKNALDIMEMSYEDKITLINGLIDSGEYDVVIVDCDFELGKKALGFLTMMDILVIISDGMEMSNQKDRRAEEAMSVLEDISDESILQRTSIIYNRMTADSKEAELRFNNIGWFPMYDEIDSDKIMEKMCSEKIFDALYEEG